METVQFDHVQPLEYSAPTRKRKWLWILVIFCGICGGLSTYKIIGAQKSIDVCNALPDQEAFLCLRNGPAEWFALWFSLILTSGFVAVIQPFQHAHSSVCRLWFISLFFVTTVWTTVFCSILSSLNVNVYNDHYKRELAGLLVGVVMGAILSCFFGVVFIGYAIYPNKMIQKENECQPITITRFNELV